MIKEISMNLDSVTAKKLGDSCIASLLSADPDDGYYICEKYLDDGNRVEMQVMGYDPEIDAEEALVQCILFSKEGRELSISKPIPVTVSSIRNFNVKFKMDYFDDTYIVNVLS